MCWLSCFAPCCEFLLLLLFVPALKKGGSESGARDEGGKDGRVGDQGARGTTS